MSSDETLRHMPEILRALRNASDGWSGDAVCIDADAGEEAAKLIERLTARVAKLEAAIKKCALTGAICCDTHHQPALGSKVQKAIESLIADETKEI